MHNYELKNLVWMNSFEMFVTKREKGNSTFNGSFPSFEIDASRFIDQLYLQRYLHEIKRHIISALSEAVLDAHYTQSILENKENSFICTFYIVYREIDTKSLVVKLQSI